MNPKTAIVVRKVRFEPAHIVTVGVAAFIVALGFNGRFTIIPSCAPGASCIELLWPNYLIAVLGLVILIFGLSRALRLNENDRKIGTRTISGSRLDFLFCFGTGLVCGGLGLLFGESASACDYITTYPFQPGCNHMILGMISASTVGLLLISLGVVEIIGLSWRMIVLSPAVKATS